MRVFALQPLPIGIVYFRDSAPRVAVIIKTTLRLGERSALTMEPAGAPLSLERPNPDAKGVAAHGNDFVPRKARPEITLVGRAHAGTPQQSFVVEVALGTSLRKRATAVAAAPMATVPLTPATLRTEAGRAAWFGPVPTAPLVASAPRDDWEAWWSDRWVDLPAPTARGDGFQCAPADQQTWEPLVPGTPLHLHNLTRGGGDFDVALPATAPWVLLVEPRRPVSAAISLPLRLDTLHVDTELGIVELLHRGEIEVARLSGRPDLVIGMAHAGEVSRAELEGALASIRPRIAAEPWPRASMPPSAPVSQTLVQSGSARTTRPQASDAEPIGTGTIRVTPDQPTPVGRGPTWRGVGGQAGDDMPRLVGGWTLGDLIESQADRAIFEARDAKRMVSGRLSVLHSAVARDGIRRAAFQLEVERRMRITHPDVIGVVDCGVADDGCPYFVEALAPGANVADLVREGRATCAVALGWLTGIFDPLEAIHRAQLVHGALRGRTVFVDGARVAIVVTPALREPGEAPRAQTPADAAHAPPEIAREEWGSVDARTDVWFAASVFFHAVQGRPLHDGVGAQRRLILAATQAAPPVSSVAPSVPTAVATLIDRALSIDPRARPGSVDEFRRELREATRPVTRESTAIMDAAFIADLKEQAQQRAAASAGARSPTSESTEIIERPRPVLETLVEDTQSGADLEEDEETDRATERPPAPAASAEGSRVVPPVNPAPTFGPPPAQAATPSARTTPSALAIPDMDDDDPRTGQVQAPASADASLPFRTTAPLTARSAEARPSQAGLPFSSATGTPPPPRPVDAVDGTGTLFGARSPAARALPFEAPRAPVDLSTPPDDAEIRAIARALSGGDEAPRDLGETQPGADVGDALPFGQRGVAATPTAPPPAERTGSGTEPPPGAAGGSATAFARIVTATPERAEAELAAAGFTELSWAVTRDRWAREIDAEAREGTATKLEELLSALHAEVMRPAARARR